MAGGNFVETMITKAKKNETINVVDDMWMSPTYTKDAATTMKNMLESRLPVGTYHSTNQGYCTWFQFAKEIFRLLRLKPALTPIETRELKMKAKRPRFSALRSTKLPKYGMQMREWKEALQDYLIEKGHNRASQFCE